MLTTLLTLSLLAQAPALTVTVQGARNDRGHVRCLLFVKAAGFPADVKLAEAKAMGAIVTGVATCTFPARPAGPYAVSAVHDENDNGVQDTNFLGMPTEGYAVTNDARGTLGPPRFEAALTNAVGPLTVTLTY